MNEEEERKFEEWSKRVSALAIDRLVDAGIIKKDEFEIAVELAAEEILIRLLLGDRPNAN